jgi:hypothetical protein
LVLLAMAVWATARWSMVSVETDGANVVTELCDNVSSLSAPGAKELSARVALMWGMVLALTASFLVLAYCYLVSLPWARQRSPIPIAFTIAAIIGVIGGWLTFNPDGYLFAAYKPLINCAYDIAQIDKERFPLAAAGNALLVFVTLSLVGSVLQTVLDLPGRIAESTNDADARDCLRKANDQIVLHLYLGSALLVTSVIGLYSYYSWPVAIADQIDSATLKNLAVIIAVLFGSIYTMVLVFVLGPAIWAVHNQAVRVAREGFGQGTEIEVKAWIAENGLRPTAFQQGIQVFAALGPLLTGPILELMSFVG